MQSKYEMSMTLIIIIIITEVKVEVVQRSCEFLFCRLACDDSRTKSSEKCRWLHIFDSRNASTQACHITTYKHHKPSTAFVLRIIMLVFYMRVGVKK